jgi:flagellar P-ring protein precursor FlgI
VPTAARVPSGATVERVVNNPFESAGQIVLNTREADFTTTTAIVNAVNQQFGDGTARALDAMTLTVRAPEDLSQRVAFVSLIENLDIQPGEPSARVVVNSRTGTVVISRNVKVSAAAVSHGAITVAVTMNNDVSQPAPFSQGQTTPVQNADIKISEDKKPMFLFQPGVDLRQIVDAVNQVGASPSSLIAILQALKSSGSLRADLIVI